ncbi:MAG: hypothetical protein ACRC7S_09830 [Cetobacterium sp.]
MNDKLKQCRFCEHLDPHEGAYWNNSTTIYMCYEYKNSCDCGIDYISSCDKFELCDDLKEVLNEKDR